MMSLDHSGLQSTDLQQKNFAWRWYFATKERETDSSEEDFSNGDSTRDSPLKKKTNNAMERPYNIFRIFLFQLFVVVAVAVVFDAQAFLKGRGNTALPRPC